jgi:hypothetical protein
VVLILGGGAFALGALFAEQEAPVLVRVAVITLGGAAFVGLIVWLIAALVVQSTTIRPQQITDYEIHLTGVSDGFVKAVKKQRRDSDDDEDEDEDDYRRRRT